MPRGGLQIEAQGQGDVELAQPTDLMSEQGDAEVPPTQAQIWVVIESFRQTADHEREAERLTEVVEGPATAQVVVVHDLPVGQARGEIRDLLGGELTGGGGRHGALQRDGAARNSTQRRSRPWGEVPRDLREPRRSALGATGEPRPDDC